MLVNNYTISHGDSYVQRITTMAILPGNWKCRTWNMTDQIPKHWPKYNGIFRLMTSLGPSISGPVFSVHSLLLLVHVYTSHKWSKLNVGFTNNQSNQCSIPKLFHQPAKVAADWHCITHVYTWLYLLIDLSPRFSTTNSISCGSSSVAVGYISYHISIIVMTRIIIFYNKCAMIFSLELCYQ